MSFCRETALIAIAALVFCGGKGNHQDSGVAVMLKRKGEALCRESDEGKQSMLVRSDWIVMWNR